MARVEEPFEIEKQACGVMVRFKAGIEVTPELIIAAMDRENELYAKAQSHKGGHHDHHTHH